MAAPGLEEQLTVQDLMWCNDTAFEETVNNLNMRELLNLVGSLQGAMAEEQRRFDQLSVQLQQCSDEAQHRVITSALCNSQMRLAILCNRNMRCFTQQAIRAKKEQWKATRSASESSCRNRSAPLVTIQKMVSPSVLSCEERTANGFRESLRFFQSQEEKGKVPKPERSMYNQKTVQSNEDLHSNNNEANDVTRTANCAPSVDNILNNVRTIYSSQNIKPTNHTSVTSVNHCNGTLMSSSRTICTNLTVDQSVSTLRTLRQKDIGDISNKISTDKKNNTLSSRFNPSFNIESDERMEINPALKDGSINHIHENSLSIVDNVGNCSKHFIPRYHKQHMPVSTNKLNSLVTERSSVENSIKHIINHEQNLSSLNKSECFSKMSTSQKEKVEDSKKTISNECSTKSSITETPTISENRVNSTSHNVTANLDEGGTKDKNLLLDKGKRSVIVNGTKLDITRKQRSNNAISLDLPKTEIEISNAQYEFSGKQCNKNSVSNGSDESRFGRRNCSPDLNSTGETNCDKTDDEIIHENVFTGKNSWASNKICIKNSDLQTRRMNLRDNSTPESVFSNNNDSLVEQNNENSEPMILDVNNCNVPDTDNLVISKLDFRQSNSNTEHKASLLRSYKEKEGVDKRISQLVDIASEKGCDSLESDYDPQDFVVHKTTYSEDYLDVTSEDAYSSVNDDFEYEVEHPDDSEVEHFDDLEAHCPDIPSPDYISDEDEEFLVHQGISQYDDDDENVEYVLDNSTHYVSDSRRYLYYPEDKELEVIPEEDEDDLDEDEDCYSQGFSDQGSPDYQYFRQTVKGTSKEIVLTECDSGVADDHSSGEDYYLEEDNWQFRAMEAAGDYDTDEIIYGTVSRNWDPTPTLLPELYQMYFKPELTWDPNRVINLEGPVMLTIHGEGPEAREARISDLLRNWPPQQLYVKLLSGRMNFYLDQLDQHALLSILLDGGHCRIAGTYKVFVEDLNENRFKFHFRSMEAMYEWYSAIVIHVKRTLEVGMEVEQEIVKHIVPCYRPITSCQNILIVDIGGVSIRAGFVMSQATLPALYFPSACVKNLVIGRHFFGFEAFKPETRRTGYLHQPFSQPRTFQFLWDLEAFRDLFIYIFEELRVEPHKYKLLLTCNRRMTDRNKREIASIILDEFRMISMHVTLETYASLCAYEANTGIVVEAGDRISVTPIVRGCLISFGKAELASSQLFHHVNKELYMTNNRSFSSFPARYILRYIMENTCYIAEDYAQEYINDLRRRDNSRFVNVEMFFKRPIAQYTLPMLGTGRFRSPEGLIEPQQWSTDSQSLPQKIINAILSVPVDFRAEVASSIYLCGGLTLIRGFKKRLLTDCRSLLKDTTLRPRVHSSEYRLHASYLGSFAIATSATFETDSITHEDLDHQERINEKWKI